MTTRPYPPSDPAGEILLRPAEVPAARWRQVVITGLERLVNQTLAGVTAGGAGGSTITAVQRGGRYAAVAVGADVDSRTLHRLEALIGGLLRGGTWSSTSRVPDTATGSCSPCCTGRRTGCRRGTAFLRSPA